MENENVLDNNLTGGIIVNDVAKRAFSETGSWAKFFSILGFIVSGLMVFGAIAMIFSMGAMGDAMGGLSGAGMGIGIGIIYLLFAVLYIFPSLYLWRFSNKVKSSVNTNNQDEFTDAIINLKSVYKFFGIFYIITIAFYLIAIVAVAGLGISGMF